MADDAHSTDEIARSGLAADVIADCYGDMRRMARRIIAGDRAGELSQATELVNEAVLRLIRTPDLAVASRGHLMVLASQTMRRALIDEARKSAAAKRAPPEYRTAWPDRGGDHLITMENLDEALTALAEVSPEHARIVELRFMLGLTVDETASATGTPARTVKRRWQVARAWLLDFLNDGLVSAPA